MYPDFPITAELSDGTIWTLDSEAELEMSIEWFDSDDPEDRQELRLSDRNGFPVHAKIEALELRSLEVLCLPIWCLFDLQVEVFDSLDRAEKALRKLDLSKRHNVFLSDSEGRRCGWLPRSLGTKKQARKINFLPLIGREQQRQMQLRLGSLERTPTHGKDLLHRLQDLLVNEKYCARKEAHLRAVIEQLQTCDDTQS